MSIKDIKTEQLLNLQKSCIENEVDFNSMQQLLDAEKIKKLQKRNNYLQQTIDLEIEKSLK